MSMLLSGDILFSYAEVYLNAVKRLASMENREYREGDWNIFAMPLLFLFRHYLELGLKACICMKKEEEILKTMSHSNTSQEELSKAKKVMDEKLKCTHDLLKLLKNMKKCFPGRDYLFSKSVQDFLNQLSNYDRKSEVFRYPFDTKGNMILPEQPIMQMDKVKNMIKEVSSELNAIASQLIEDLNLLRV